MRPLSQPSHEHELIDGRWRVVGKPIGGGMASVVECEDEEREFGHVAVKRLPVGDVDSWRLAALERERRSLERLRHPNIVELLYEGRDPETRGLYLVFPWLERRLTDVLREAGAVSWERWWESWGQPIAGALDEAHRQNVAHRDLKPGNVLIDSAGEPQVIDFGIAKLMDTLAPERTVRGDSPPFTPSENTPLVDMCTRDVFSWAAMAVFAITAADPYAPEGEDPYAPLDGALERSSDRVPPGVARVLRRCLDSDPKKRPATGGVLVADVNAALEADRKRDQRAQAAEAPVAHVRVTRAVRESLEAALDLFPAQVDEMIARDLSGPVSVGPYPKADGHFRLVGAQMSYHVATGDQGEQLFTLSVAPEPDSALERQRVRGWSGPVRFALTDGAIRDREAARDAIDYLRTEVVAHVVERDRADQRNVRARTVAVWRGVVSLMRTLEATREDPVAYRSVRNTTQGAAFRLRGRPPDDFVGQRRTATTDGERQWIGDVVQLRDGEAVLRSISGNRSDIALRGELRLDSHAAMVAIDRQQRALDAVEYGRAKRPGLVDLLTAPGRARQPNPIRGLRQPGIDTAKRHAVAAALGSEDILIVRGPPGTGKTTFIAELVMQELARADGVRILISSQNHSALDHALAEIRQRDPTVKLLRLARPGDERVAEDMEPFLLNAQLAEWAADAVVSGSAWLRRWARERAIDVGDIEAIMALRELAAQIETSRELAESAVGVDRHIKDLRREARRASPSATTMRVIDERLEDLEEIKERQRTADGRVRDEVKRLQDLGELSRRTRIGSLEPADLRARADELLPDDRKTAKRCEELVELLADWHARFGIGPHFNAAALLRAQVVAATCVGFGGVRGADAVEFDLCVVDEASKAMPTELLIPMAQARRFVLVGDEYQLPPYIDEGLLSPVLLEEQNLEREEVVKPLFTQLAEELPSENVCTLTHQHRMHPAIGRLVSDCFYGGTLTSEPRKRFSLLDPIAPRPVTWLSTTASNRRRERRVGLGVQNQHEADVIADFLGRANELARAKSEKLDIAVLTGYAKQKETLEELFARELDRWDALAIEVATVDSFQGRQADIVVYSLTRSNRDGRMGFLRERPRVNVALSRARDLLVIVGDHAFARAAHDAEHVQRVLDHIDAHPNECGLKAADL